MNLVSLAPPPLALSPMRELERQPATEWRARAGEQKLGARGVELFDHRRQLSGSCAGGAGSWTSCVRSSWVSYGSELHLWSSQCAGTVTEHEDCGQFCFFC
eukprot:6779862-Prymnesium_polylepis.1